jgi:alkanesulfonate monooxygenase SsuD/methylene tetrahydromethanopterin reductase-like flavin-dependent oxidoreductase (luciferase family)
VTHDDQDRPLSHAQTIRNLVEQGVLADQVGVDFFGIGEHHTDDMPLSAADVVLGAIAARTTRIRLGSAVTVLSSDDPVRVFQRYSTLNAISGGRAEVILGRGSSVDSFPLFGYDLADYEELFEEKPSSSPNSSKEDRLAGGATPALRSTIKMSCLTRSRDRSRHGSASEAAPSP